MTLVLVEHMDDVLSVALADPKIAAKFEPEAGLMIYKEGRLVTPEKPAPSPKQALTEGEPTSAH